MDEVNWVDVLILMLFFSSGYVLGYMRVKRAVTRSKPKEIKPICDCEHSLAHHDRETGMCHSQIERERFDYIGNWTGHEYTPCTCRRYVGPEPIEKLWMPPIRSSDENEV